MATTDDNILPFFLVFPALELFAHDAWFDIGRQMFQIVHAPPLPILLLQQFKRVHPFIPDKSRDTP